MINWYNNQAFCNDDSLKDLTAIKCDSKTGNIPKVITITLSVRKKEGVTFFNDYQFITMIEKNKNTFFSNLSQSCTGNYEERTKPSC